MSILSLVDLLALQQTFFKGARKDKGVNVLSWEVNVTDDCVVVHSRHFGVGRPICSCAINACRHVSGFGTDGSRAWGCHGSDSGTGVNSRGSSRQGSKSLSRGKGMEVLMLITMRLGDAEIREEDEDCNQHQANDRQGRIHI